MPLPDTPRTRKHPTDHEVDSPKTKKLKAFRVVDASIITDLSSTHDTTDNDNGGEIDYNKIKELLKLARQATRYALELYTYYPEEDSRAESKAQTLLSKEAIWQAQKVYKELKRCSQRIFLRQTCILSPDQLNSLPISPEECVNICWQINLGYMSQILWLNGDNQPYDNKTKYGSFLVELAENLKQVASFMDVTSFSELVEIIISVKIQAVAIWSDKRKNTKLVKDLFYQDENQVFELDDDVEWMQEFKRTLKEKQEKIYTELIEMSLQEIREKFPYKEFQDAIKEFMCSMANYLQSTLNELQDEDTLIVPPQVIGTIYRDYPDGLDGTLNRIRVPASNCSTSNIIHTSFVELMEAQQKTSDTNKPSRNILSTSPGHKTKKRYIYDRDETATRMKWSDDEDNDNDDNVSIASPSRRIINITSTKSTSDSHKQTIPRVVVDNALGLLRNEYHDMSKQFDSFIEEQPSLSEDTNASNSANTQQNNAPTEQRKSPLPSIASQPTSNSPTDKIQNKREALRSTHVNQQIDDEDYESELSVISKESSEGDVESDTSSYKTAKSPEAEEAATVASKKATTVTATTSTASATVSESSSITTTAPLQEPSNNQENEQVDDMPTTTTHLPTFSRAQKRRPWTNEETNALIKAMNELGICWRAICNKYGKENGPLAGRTNVQLKDKARNIRLYRLRNNIDLGIFALLGSDPSK